MRALRCEEYGGPDRVLIREIPTLGSPAPGHVVVRVAAAAVNFPDLLLLADKYQVSVPLPFTPGGEFAGTVDAVGEGVTSVGVGDRVMGMSMHGAFAELVDVSASALAVVPEGMSAEDAASLRVAHQTAYHALVTFGSVRPGEHVVVLGAAGGVGSATVALATRMGAQVIAVTRSGRADLPSLLGAETCIAPGPLARFYRRYGIHEPDEAQTPPVAAKAGTR